MRFSVLVVGPDCANALQDVLMPYFEHTNFPPYIKFNREDKKAERKRIKRYWGKKLRENPHDVGIFNKYEETNISDEEYWRKQTKHYDSCDLDDNGNPISTYNPNSRWNDWEYEKRLLSRYTDTHMQAMKKKDVDWAGMAECKRKEFHVSWHMMFSPGFPEPTAHERACNDYWDGETKEQYMERSKFFLTHAYILHGKWYERSKVGFWKVEKYNTVERYKWVAQYEKMLTQVKPNTVLTTIECVI